MQYRAGDWVEVLSAEEILKTLDDNGAIDKLPFMPEMLQYCGKRFEVSASAHKSCDTIYKFKGRRMEDAVHLTGLRCDGQAHGGCQAACLLYFKTAWLKPAKRPEAGTAPLPVRPSAARELKIDTSRIDRATRLPPKEGDTEIHYSCQATRLVDATVPQAWNELGQYWKDLTSGNVSPWTMLRFMLLAGFNAVMRSHWRGRPWPYIRGLAGDKTPTESLNLQEGELVEVRSKAEIMQTLNAKQRNRGMWFDVEQVPHCGKRYRVHKRVDQIINEQSGAMMKMANPCIILEGVACSGCYSRDRLFCPRAIYSYWREIWLKRVQ